MGKRNRVDYTLFDLINENGLTLKIGLLGEGSKRPTYYSLSKLGFTTYKNATCFSDEGSPNSQTSLTAASEIIYDLHPHLDVFATLSSKSGDKVDVSAERLFPDRIFDSLFDGLTDELKERLAVMKLKVMGNEFMVKEKKKCETQTSSEKKA